MELYQKIFSFLSDKLKMIGAFCLFGMAALTCVDVIGRFFKHPIFGSVELVSFLGVIAIATTLSFTHEHKGHIGVELFVRKLSSRTRNIIDLCTGSITLALFAVVTWRMFDYSLKMKSSGELSMNLKLPEYIIIFLLACCFFIYCGTILSSIFQTLAKLGKR
ncbi:MAG: hypothetical protein VR65_22220 [Desulfobulbaceae bacterium BRH_c16a]|nr:MAG: hypothetical protein VR65_22220 [Desulfobulbaceae bacterium BRH_c16a]